MYCKNIKFIEDNFLNFGCWFADHSTWLWCVVTNLFYPLPSYGIFGTLGFQKLGNRGGFDYK
jgi:hypothetical protein